ncbi:MAG: SEL1-like repeat protein [Acidobacteriaceae bacterium]
MVYILAQTVNSRMVLTCTRNARWSQCNALNPGSFTARIHDGHLEVEALSGRNKEKWIKFDVVEQFAIARQQSPPSTSENTGRNTRFTQFDGNSEELESQAKSGVLAAQMYLGYAYEIGKGVPENPTIALVWFRKALAEHPEIAITDRQWIENQIGAIQGELARGKQEDAAH